mgnify:CR=1 FL=1
MKKIDDWEMKYKLGRRGYTRDDIEDAVNEAERRKIVCVKSGFSFWIEPEHREEEKEKTQRYFAILADTSRTIPASILTGNWRAYSINLAKLSKS